jgi:hypothetical protein
MKCVSVFILLSERQVGLSLPSSVIVGQVVTEINRSLFLTGELDNNHYDANLQDLE